MAVPCLCDLLTPEDAERELLEAGTRRRTSAQALANGQGAEPA
jgi:hypothetical protein